MPPDSDQRDGRRVRSQRSQQILIDTVIALAQQGDLSPSAEKVATLSGVGLRTVFRHFSNLRSLRLEALRATVARNLPLLQVQFVDSPLDRREQSYVSACCRFYAAIAPLHQALLAAGPVGRQPVEWTPIGDARRQLIESCFAEELGLISSEPSDLKSAIDAASSFPTWSYLQGISGRSNSTTERILLSILSGIISQAPQNHESSS